MAVAKMTGVNVISLFQQLHQLSQISPAKNVVNKKGGK